MGARAGWSTPLLHVADVARSLRFYERLGFETIDTEGDGATPGWARMHCEGGALMFLAAEEPIDAAKQGVLLYLYCPDLPALRTQLVGAGVEVSPITHPEHMASGEIHLRDPDGYSILVGHWGRAEHEEWERRLAGKKARASADPSSPAAAGARQDDGERRRGRDSSG